MIAYVPFTTLATMPADKAKAIRKRAHVIDGRGVRIPRKDLEEITAGLVVTPEMELIDMVDHSADPTLLGNRLEKFFDRWGVGKAALALERLGVPCNCKERRDFINHIHAKAREIKARLAGGGA